MATHHRFADQDAHIQIVSIAGGGYMGLFSAELLRHVEQSGISIHGTTDLFAGTSVGSLIALGLASGVSAATIVKEMTDHGQQIFPHLNALPFGNPMLQQVLQRGLRAPYASEPLRKVLEKLLGPIKLGELGRRVIVPAVEVTTGRLKIFRGGVDGPDAETPVVDVALASAAAPTYFPMHPIADRLYSDGGLIANAPDALAAEEALGAMGGSKGRIRMLAVGTTLSRPGLALGESPKDWGVKDWASVLLEFSSFGQVELSRKLAKAFLGAENVLQLDPFRSASESESVALDKADAGAKQTLKAVAQNEFQRLSEDAHAQRFLTLWRHHVAVAAR